MLTGLKNPAQGYTQQQLEDFIRNAKELQKDLEVGKGKWIDYAEGIKVAEERLKSYETQQKEIEETNRRTQTDKVLADPSAKGITQQQLVDAIKHGKELQSQLEYLGDDWKDYAEKIKLAEQRLKEYDETQKSLADTTRAQSAITDAASIRKADGTFDISANEAKARAESIEKYIGSLNMSTQADEIKKATDALNLYNEALGKIKDKTVDVSAILANPKNFSSEELTKGIKQLEETGKAIKESDYALPEEYTRAIQENLDNVNKLKAALADKGYSETFVAQVIKDAEKGEASVEELEKAIAMTKEKLRHSKDATMTEKLRQDLDKLNPQLELTKTSLKRVTETLGNVKGANLGSLREAAERLKAELNDVNFNMDEFADKAAQLKEVNAQIKELEARTKNVSSAWDNAISRLKNWVLIYAGSSEIWNKAVESYRGVLKLSDAMSDVRKTTGLTNEEVVKLTDQIQELDTRITNEKLMDAATEAGRIGLKTREEVLQFTRASAITLTALDELDARSITSVMKLNGLLGETARLGVQQAILSTASSINELSMASSAAQQPIIDFSRRYGGIAAQANISTAEVLGLGATIDALGQPIEMSSTALNKFTTALLSNGKAIAEDTGLSEEYIFEMTRQGKTIELMIEVLSKLNNMGGIGEISKYMGDMGGEGARMTAVISALAANLGFLRQNIDLSKQSFEEGISVINEYNLKNENAAALVERIGNEIREFFVNSSWVSVITTLVRWLQQLVHFMTSGSTAAKIFNSALLLVIARIANGSKAIKSFNLSIMLFISNLKSGEERMISLGGVLKALTAGVKGLGRAIKGLFFPNPFGWVLAATFWILDLIVGSKDLEEQVEHTKDAMERANESFEQESYKLNKLKDALEEAKKSGSGFAEIISTLNRDYGKQIGYVLDLAAGYREVAGAIDLASAASRKEILQKEKDRNFQIVQDEYREQTNTQINALKSQIGFGSQEGKFEFFSETAQRDLYAAIAADLNKSAVVNGKAELGSEVEAVLRRQAKTSVEAYYKTVEGLTDEELAKIDTSARVEAQYKFYQTRLEEIDAVEKLANIYTQKTSKLKMLDEEVDRQLVSQSAVVVQLQQQQIDIVSSENELANKAAKDYTAADEHTLNSIISLYEDMLIQAQESMDMSKVDEINEHLKSFKTKQREVMLAFVENPLRGIKMKVGEDGKLYKEVLENGKYQYEAVKELSDANLRQLVDAYKRTDTTFQALMSDSNRLMDSEVRKQAEQLSKVKTAINTELNKNGLSIDDKYELKLRNTEYRDGSSRKARSEESEMRKAYQALLANIKAYYEEKKRLVNEDFINGANTVEQKNRRIEELERQHKDTVTAMQAELLQETSDINRSMNIRDRETHQKVLGWMVKDEKDFQKELRRTKKDSLDIQIESTARYQSEVERIFKENSMSEQLNEDIRQSFEQADMFWGKTEKRTEQAGIEITYALKQAARESYEYEGFFLRKRLEQNEVFGQSVKEMNKDEYAQFVGMLKSYHNRVLEDDRKFSEQRARTVQNAWQSGGFEDEYQQRKVNISEQKIVNKDVTESSSLEQRNDEYMNHVRRINEEIQLEQWKYQSLYQLAVKAGESEERLAARSLEYAEKLKVLQVQKQKELSEVQSRLGISQVNFNEELYIRDLNEYRKVQNWMLKDTHHFQDLVRADMKKTERESIEMQVKYMEEVAKIIMGNDYQAQVDTEMQDSLERAGVFWGEQENRTAENAARITQAMKVAAKDAYAVESDKYVELLKQNEVFGENVRSMTEEQQQALVILLQQYHDKTIEADKKFADQRRKLTQQMWESNGYENEYNYASSSIKERQEQVKVSKDFGAISNREAFEEQHKLTLEQWALEEWKFQMQYQLAIKAGETEEQLLARRMEMAEMEKDMQRQVTEAYLAEYNRRADAISKHADKFGEFAGVMASAAWNSVEDRKKAGEELLKYIAQETAEYIRELLVRKIKEEVLRRQGLDKLKKGEEEKHDIEQKGQETSTTIAEMGGKIKTNIEEEVAGNVSNIAESSAVQSATTAVNKAQVDSAAGAASGAAKTIGELGWWGIPLIAAIEGVISMLLNMAIGALSSSFGKSASTSGSSKRLATGMLTYAEGRYPTLGDDGRTYDAQFEPRLQTKVYKGGHGKAHMALFSEVMPEMVVSGPTTKIIQEDYPALMNAIMTIDKYGTLPKPVGMRRYESGNLDDFEVDMVRNSDGTYVESPAIIELRQSNTELREAVAQLTSVLANGIQANINMYGTGGIKESMDKANRFYTKNRIKPHTS